MCGDTFARRRVQLVAEEVIAVIMLGFPKAPVARVVDIDRAARSTKLPPVAPETVIGVLEPVA